MDMFARDLAQISSEAWEQIEEQAKKSLRDNLAARRFVDVKGPYGWERSCIGLGRLTAFEKFGDVGYGVHKCIRFVETRTPFELDMMELHLVDRGCKDVDLVPVEQAAAAAASFEDKIVFDGLHEAGIKGMKGGSDLPAVDLSTSDVEAFIRTLDDTTSCMKHDHGIEGPYVLVGGKALRHTLGKLVAGRSWLEIAQKNTKVERYVYTPTFDGAMLVSTRGGDLRLYLGGDFTVGFSGREGQKLKFFIAESAAFRITEPRAFVELKLA